MCRRWKVVTVTIATLCCVNAFGETRRAVVIGINKYVTTESPTETVVTSKGRPRGEWINLDGAVNDAEEFAALIETRFDFPKENVVILRNGDATRDGIIATVHRVLIDPAKPGDVSVLYYSGHGSQMFNSQSKKPDKLDETIVPADSARGKFDIRDKEISRLLNDMLDKKAIVTAIFDSCHSGSISRGWPAGKARYILPDPRDAAKVMPPVDPGPEPDSRGALIISSAQANQSAFETEDENRRPHGLFTAALLRTLRSTPLDESVRDIMLTVQASMNDDARGQQSGVEAIPERQQRPIFGVGTASANGKTRVGVRRDERSPGVFIVDAGIAIGLAPNAELKEVTSDAPPVMLRITEVNGLARSVAKVISGNTKKIKSSALFEIDKWVPTDRTVRVWWNTDGPRQSELNAAAHDAAQLASSSQIKWVDDPTALAPDYVVQWKGHGWSIRTIATGSTAELGPSLGVDAIVQNVNRPVAIASAKDVVAGAHGRNLYIDFPAPREVVDSITVGAGGASAAERASSPATAQYVLQGRLNNGTLEYAWVVPNLLASELEGSNGQRQSVSGNLVPVSAEASPREKAPLPPHTEWLELAESSAVAAGELTPAQALGDELTDYVLRLARLVRWREIQAPPDNGMFPYHLAFKSAAPDEKDAIVKSGPFFGGERYYPVLVAAHDMLRHKVAQRYVYVFIIDSNGTGKLLFPTTAHAQSENHVPYETNNKKYPAVVKLGGDNALPIRISPPYGVDTYVLLSSAQRVEDPATAFNFSGVIRGQKGVAHGGGLSVLLHELSAGSKGAFSEVPTDWSIERLTIDSKEPVVSH